MQAEHQDVCKNGFRVNDQADAVFLDLPAPWDALCHAKLALNSRKKTRICCFSPCIEQVQRTIQALEASGYAEIELFNCLLREWEVRRVAELDFPEPIPQETRKRHISSVLQQESNSTSLSVVAQPKSKMRGHTSFLTFAVLYPADSEAIAADSQIESSPSPMSQ